MKKGKKIAYFILWLVAFLFCAISPAVAGNWMAVFYCVMFYVQCVPISVLVGRIRASDGEIDRLRQMLRDEWTEKRAREQYDRMAPIYSEQDSFEVALLDAWRFYEKSGAMLVDACEDDRTEFIFSKGFREGVLYGKKTKGGQKEQKPIFRIGDTLKKKGKEYTFTIDKIQGGFYLTRDEHFFPIEDQDTWELVEQKPVEWSEEDVHTRFAFYTYKDQPEVLYLSNVYVEESSRNRGLGSLILIAAEKVAETIGAITIRLKVKQDSPANAWYRKHGYGYMTFEDGYDWLEKTLEYLKPFKQEWSKEDENKFELLHTCICRCITDPYWDYSKREKVLKEIIPFVEKLKSLVTQSQWKPSEEQPEVDIRKELDRLELMGSNDARDIQTIARHFYELGLNARK